METLPAQSPTSKQCTKCGEVLPLSCFWPRSDTPRAYRPWCIACTKRADRSRYKANPTAHSKLCVAWAKANRTAARAIRERYEAKNGDRLRAEARAAYAEKRRAKKAAYRKANAERIKARNAEYRQRNADTIREANKAYYDANKSIIRDRVSQSVAKNPDLYKSINKAAKHRRRARIIANGPVESFKDREIFERDNWVCGLCGGLVDPAIAHPDPLSASLDHRKPLVKGGGHTRDNVQLAHLRCNLRKRDRENERAPRTRSI